MLKKEIYENRIGKCASVEKFSERCTSQSIRDEYFFTWKLCDKIRKCQFVWYCLTDKISVIIECFFEYADTLYLISQIKLWERHTLEIFQSTDWISNSCKLGIEKNHEPEIFLETIYVSDKFFSKVWLDNFYNNIPSSPFRPINLAYTCFRKSYIIYWFKLLAKIFFKQIRSIGFCCIKIFLIQLCENICSINSDKISTKCIELSNFCCKKSLLTNRVQIWNFGEKYLVDKSKKGEKRHKFIFSQ